MNREFEEFAPQGWQCPICKRVYSPMTMMCFYCNNGNQAYTVSNETVEIHTSDGKLSATDVYSELPKDS